MKNSWSKLGSLEKVYMRISNPPVARNLMVTARSFGNYDLAAALADLVDNSIKAKASKVSISFEPREDDVVVRICDNGKGMDCETLTNAMRPASTNPEDHREPDDLGRFGWGLKSASLSQARILTVASWQNDVCVAARWDIDNIDDWSMDLFEGEDAKKYLSLVSDSESGTEVIWTNTDRLVQLEGSRSVIDCLAPLIAHAINKLSLIFHRYLSGEATKAFSISVNGNTLKPIDPFMISHDATQTLDAEVIWMPDGGKIQVQPYVLPHFSKLTVEDQDRLGSAEGMIRNQGFYVYRNKRLIIHGTWFRIVPHGDLTQLTRVKVDLPNSMDANWRITVDKSDAQLPSVLKKRLQNIVRKFNKRSVKVHRNKGVSLDRENIQAVWKRYVKNGRVRYLINREHPLLAGLLDDESVGDNLNSVMNMLEAYFPTDMFLKDAELGVSQCSVDSHDYDSLIHQCCINYSQSCIEPLSIKNFLQYISNMEPFASQMAYTESYVKKNLSGLLRD
jgi:hypothetical protein